MPKIQAKDVNLDLRNVEFNGWRDAIFAASTELDIFKYYLGDKFRIKKPIKSPLRRDDNPSFSVYQSESGFWKWNDFAAQEGGDCFSFVQRLLGVDYITALKIVYNDLVKAGKKPVYLPAGDNMSDIQQTVTNNFFDPNLSITKITPIKRAFNAEDIEYWKKFYINITLLTEFNVFPCSKVWVNGSGFPIKEEYDNPMYAFQFSEGTAGRYKIYRPKEQIKGRKWLSNANRWDIMGMHMLAKGGNICLITKSMKDVMLLHKMGLNAVAPQSEGIHVPYTIIEDLKKRFKHVIVFYDYDEAGIRAAVKICDAYRLKCIYTHQDRFKDISSLCHNMGLLMGQACVKTELQTAIGMEVGWDYITMRT